jgi:predicted ATPase
MFEHLEIRSWRQFGNVDLHFHRQLTVLTGANGTGKTTLLNILSRHFGWNLSLLSTPRKDRKGVLRYVSDYWLSGELDEQEAPPGALEIGSITYSDAALAKLLVPSRVQHEYKISIQNQRPVEGIFVPSHRPVHFYAPVANIPTQINAKQQLFDTYLDELRSRYNINARVKSPSYRIKETLISLAMFGYGNEVVARNEDAVNMFEGFQRTLQTVLPDTLGFRRIVVRLPEVVLETETGEFSFDAVSGGISAILDITWQIYMASLLHERFVTIIDEPENHLHPKLQQALMPKLLAAFPQAQFIVATHNPFIVSSVADSSVYVLRYEVGERSSQRVRSDMLDFVNKSGSSNEILRDVLGLDFTIPPWAQEKIEQIVSRYSRAGTEAELQALEDEMSRLGMRHLFPEALTRVLAGKREPTGSQSG